MRALCMVVVVFGMTGSAQARDFAFQFTFGLNAEAEIDKFKLKGSPSNSGESEDLETNLGITGVFDTIVSPNFKVGVRGAWMQAQGEDTNGKYNTVDGGLSLRLVFPQLRALPFAHMAAGATFVTIDESKRFDNDATGLGWHIVVGGGMEHPITPTMNVIVGAYFSRQAANLEAETLGVATDIEGLVISRILFSGGIAF